VLSGGLCVVRLCCVLSGNVCVLSGNVCVLSDCVVCCQVVLCFVG